MKAQCYFPTLQSEEITRKPAPGRRVKRTYRMLAMAVNKTDAPRINKPPKRWSLSWRPGQGWV